MPRHWTEYPYPHYYWLNFGPHSRPASRTDDEIATDLTNRLTGDSWVNPDHVKVTVHHGVVTLTGQVGSIMEKRAAG